MGIFGNMMGGMMGAGKGFNRGPDTGGIKGMLMQNRGIGPSALPPQGGMLGQVGQMGQQIQPPQMGQGGMMGPMIERLMREQPPPPGWQPPPYDPTQGTDQGGWGNYQPKPRPPGMLDRVKQQAQQQPNPMAPSGGMMNKIRGFGQK